MFKRFLLAGAFLALGLVDAEAQSNAVCQVVSSCATATYSAGSNRTCTQDVTGQLCTAAVVSASATITPFAPTAQVPLAVTTVTANVALPAGTSVILCNSGSNIVYYKFGTNTVTAATTDIKLPAGICIADSPGANTYIAAITAASTSALDISGGAGLPAFGTIPSTAGSSTNLTGINGVTPLVGTGASGTGALRVAVSTDSTYTVAATESGTWTVQPGNTANTTPWLMSISAGGNTAAVKAASTAAAATDPAAVVAISPNNTVAVTESGTWTVQPGNTANTTAWLTNDSADMTGTVPGTAPSKTQIIGGIYNSTPPTLTTGQTAPLQMDADGGLNAYASNILTSGSITTQNLNLPGAATAGSAVTMSTDGRGVGTIQVSGTWTGTLILQLTNDGANWVTAGGAPFQNDNTSVFSSTIASGATGIWTVEVAGHAQWRVTSSAAVTGTAVVTTLAAQGTDRVNIGSNPTVTATGVGAEASASAGNPVRVGGWNGTNTYTLKTDTSGQLLMGATANIIGKVGIDQTTPGTTNLVATNADAAIAPGTAPAKSLVTGGVYNATPPTLTTGQTAAHQLDADGSLYTNSRDWTVAGATPAHYLSGATTNSTNVKATAGTLFSITAVNTTATIYYLKLYDKATAPTCGTDTPVHTLPVPASATGSGLTINPFIGLNFTTGIGFCLTGAIADADATSAAVGVAINVGYK